MTIDELAEKIEKLSTDMGTKIETLDKKISALTNDMKTVKNRISTLSNDMENVKAVVSSIEKRKKFERKESFISGGFDRAIGPTTGVGLDFRPHRTEFF